ncbi:MAG TPA: heme lyase CcmF/NrfE family subunit [Gammaproteobacteria bacterium]|nr:heme lyase CcmF/NrfE family subunit [Gammaproteobacteria bacterium]
MIPELGLFSLILAFCLAGLQWSLPWLGLLKHNNFWMQSARPIALGQSFFISISFLCLLYAFVQNDFSVSYVAYHSNTSLPLVYKISALWGGHEGSLLLWIFLLSTWTTTVSLTTRHLPAPFLARILIVLGMISFGFLLFLLATSNPFVRLLPNYPVDGRDLNPLLQDFGLIIHPPLLYMGYVGFAIPFAFAMSTLWGGDRTLPFAKWMRSWTLLAFSFLTIGIALGSWWAYYELGWGGWWFWDPVENASFMPWIVAIALIHTLMLSDKRQIFQGWTLLLAILVFALSLLGTFLVRSGVLTSVHAFANDPRRGIFLLEFLLVVVSAALTLYSFRAKNFIDNTKVDLISRETAIVISTIFLVVSSAAILLGTLFPLAFDALTNQKLSVGFPYFNAVFIPFIIPVLLLMPLGSMSKWGHNVLGQLLKKLRWIIVSTLFLAVALPLFFAETVPLGVVIGLGLGLWIILGTLKWVFDKIQTKGSVLALSKGAFGMFFSHMGIAVLVIGVTLVSYYQIEREVAITLHQALDILEYKIIFEDLKPIEGPNYVGSRGHFLVFKQGKKEADLFPEKRIFVVQGLRMTETAIDPGFFRDIYISLGEPLKEGGWSVRIYYKPFVRWIWLGALMMALGGFFSAWGRWLK